MQFDLREAKLEGSSPNFEKLLLFSKSKDGDTRSFATHIDTTMKNKAGANNIVLNGHWSCNEGLIPAYGKSLGT